MMTDAMTSRLRPVQPGKTTLVAVLDIGSTKICCIIARLVPRAEGKALRGRTHQAEVMGFGYGPAAGVKSGVVTEIDKAEQAIRNVVGMAERAAGLTSKACWSTSPPAGWAPKPSPPASRSTARKSRRPTSCACSRRSIPARCAPNAPSFTRCPSAIPSTGRRASATQGPRGRKARRRRRRGQRRDAGHAQSRARAAPLPPADRGAGRHPYASGLATLVDDEAQLGVAAIDFGGATTTVSVFNDGHMVYADAIAIGGHHLTLDIARQLSVSVADAERLKTFYGSVLPGQSDERDMIPIQPVGASHDEAPARCRVPCSPASCAPASRKSSPPSATACRPPA